MKLRDTTEHEIQTMSNNYLTMRGWKVMRLNSGRVPISDKTGKKRLIMLAEPGTPDSLAFKQRPQGLCLLFIEYKRPGKKPTPLQTAKMAELRSYGAHCVVISSVEMLQDYLKTIDL